MKGLINAQNIRLYYPYRQYTNYLYLYTPYALHYFYKEKMGRLKVRLHTAINQANFVYWCLLIYVQR